jgi:predicted amidophosphoribosyltransferase
MAAYYFTQSSVLQQLIHSLKYENHQAAGLQLGRWMGLQLAASNRFQRIDAIVPLPLFALKEKRRGYNQAAVLSEGIAAILQKPVVTDFVHRKRSTASFEASPTHSFHHVLLVDDVITTGATVEACSSALLECNIAVSIAVLAWSSDD